MDDHTQMSWKEDGVITQLHNSVDNVRMAVGQALTNPSEQFIENALNKINHANRSFANALENEGDIEPIRTLQEQFDQDKERLNRLH